MAVERQDVATDVAPRAVEGQPAGIGLERQGPANQIRQSVEGQALPDADGDTVEGQDGGLPPSEKNPFGSYQAPPVSSGQPPQTSGPAVVRRNF